MKPEDYINHCHYGDSRSVLREMVRDGVKCQACITSPPYFGLRSYLDSDDPDKHLEIGTESLDDYIANLVDVFRQVKALLNDDGILWVNISDSYNGSGGAGGDYNTGGNREGQPKYRGHSVPGLKPKNLIGVPWRVALALQADGWWLRSDIIWNKSRYLPESVKDRCTRIHEYIFMLTKSQNYTFNVDEIREPHSPESFLKAKSPTCKLNNAENPGIRGDKSIKQIVTLNPLGKLRTTVWTMPVPIDKEKHYARFPLQLVSLCILASSRPGDTILDPFFGSGTTGEAAERLGRKWIGIELNKKYAPIIERRTAQMGLFT